jgi:hypothetical protein
LRKVSEVESDPGLDGDGSVYISENMMHIKAICSRLIQSSRKQQKQAFQHISALLDSANSQRSSDQSVPETLLASAVAHIIDRLRSSEIEAILSISMDNARFSHALSHSSDSTKKFQAMAWLEVSRTLSIPLNVCMTLGTCR